MPWPDDNSTFPVNMSLLVAIVDPHNEVYPVSDLVSVPTPRAGSPVVLDVLEVLAGHADAPGEVLDVFEVRGVSFRSQRPMTN